MTGPLIARGRTAEVFAWRPGEVVKVFYDWYPTAWAKREAETAGRISEIGLPAPSCLGTVNVGGRFGIVYERVEGPTMLTVLTAKPWLLARMAHQLAELHAQVHGCDAAGFPSLKDSLRTAIAGVGALSETEKTQVLSALDKLSDSGALCHFDFHPDQVLMTREGPVIIDWLTACRGDPAADVARTQIIFAGRHLAARPRWQRTIASVGRRRFAELYRRHYLAITPSVRDEHVNAWIAPVAAARLREEIAEDADELVRIVRSAIAPSQ